MATIEVSGLCKKYGEFAALDDVSFSVAEGEIFAFLGPNGAGKTTTIRLLMGFLEPTAGRATILGRDCFLEHVEVKRRVGYLPDEPSFFMYTTGYELLEFVGQMHGLGPDQVHERAMRLIERLGLEEASGEYAMNYSTGMKKKLGIAAALMNDPALIVLDEPTNGLDPRAAHEVDELLAQEAAAGKTVFLSTHLLDRAEKLCSRLALINEGRLVALGSIGELRRDLVAGGSLEELFLKLTVPPSDAPGSAAS